MRKIPRFALLPVLACSCFGEVASSLYRPLGAESETSFTLWNSIRESARAPIADGNRPVLPGINGRYLELLQDALARKNPHFTQGSSIPVARRILAETTQSSFPKLRGSMAEALFLDSHPDWRYVSRSNAPQHDVFVPRSNGMPPWNGQIKFHIDGDPASYARDMLKDHRAHNFFVPDDHVESLRTYLSAEADRLNSAGRTEEASVRYRDLNRVLGIGATSRQIDSATRQAFAESRVIRVAPYIFLGVASTLMVAPTVWDWSQGEIDSEVAATRLTRVGSPILAGVGADLALKQWRGGLLRGTIKGNVIMGCVVMMAETGWQVYEHGGLEPAVHNADFIINFGGNISATAFGLAGGYAAAEVGAAAGSGFGPAGSLVGAGAFGLIGGAGGAAVGFWGGSRTTRLVMEKWFPEMLFQQEREQISYVRQGLADSISRLQNISFSRVK